MVTEMGAVWRLIYAYNQAPVTITGRDAQQPTTASPYIGFRVVNKI